LAHLPTAAEENAELPPKVAAMRLPAPVIFISMLLLSGGAQAAPNDPIGSAVTVVNFVTASLETDGEQRRLSSGDDVRQQELIETDADSRSEIELNDRTKLALGPGSRLLLDKFIYDPDISGGAIVMNLVKGTFRFITGIAVKPAYVIRTPAASITVRGTIFDVYVENANETLLLLIEGGVEVCTQSGKCLVHDQPGKLIRITADDIEEPAKWSQMNRRQDIAFDGAFPFVVSPPYIDPNPIFTRDDIVLGGTEDNDDYREPERPTKSKPPKVDNDDDYTPPPRKVKLRKKIEYREYPRHTDYHPKRKSRGREILKKGVKVGIGVGIGIGVGYGLAKALKGKKY
jgi:hypothetical protein